MLNGTRVSRKPGVLRAAAGGDGVVETEDLGSSNGIFVNGVRV